VFVTSNDAAKMDYLFRPYFEHLGREANKRGDLMRLEAETNPALVPELLGLVRDVMAEVERGLMRGLNPGTSTDQEALPDGTP
jgi:hypothetical protein